MKLKKKFLWFLAIIFLLFGVAGISNATTIDLTLTSVGTVGGTSLFSADLTGIDIVLDVTNILYESFGERFLPNPLIKIKCAAGEVGRKAGKGFYDYSQR